MEVELTPQQIFGSTKITKNDLTQLTVDLCTKGWTYKAIADECNRHLDDKFGVNQHDIVSVNDVFKFKHKLDSALSSSENKYIQRISSIMPIQSGSTIY